MLLILYCFKKGCERERIYQICLMYIAWPCLQSFWCWSCDLGTASCDHYLSRILWRRIIERFDIPSKVSSPSVIMYRINYVLLNLVSFYHILVIFLWVEYNEQINKIMKIELTCSVLVAISKVLKSG